MENKVRWAEYNDTTFLKKRCGVCIRKGCFTVMFQYFNIQNFINFFIFFCL